MTCFRGEYAGVKCYIASGQSLAQDDFFRSAWRITVDGFTAGLVIVSMTVVVPISL